MKLTFLTPLLIAVWFTVQDVNGAMLTWNACTAKQARLAQPDSQPKNAEIVRAILEFGGVEPYFGASKDPNGLNQWQYTDSSAVNFTDWRSGQPNNPTTAHCIFWDVGRLWNDAYCTDKRQYMCERAAPITPCSNCREVMDGPLSGTYNLLRSEDPLCPATTDGCIYEDQKGDLYCFQDNGLYETKLECN